MEKDFDAWNEVQKDIESISAAPLCFSGEIWMCSLGVNIGTEIYGKGNLFMRPILVYKVFDQSGFLGIPMSTHVQSGSHFYTFNLGGIDNSAILHQMKFLSAKRLYRLITHMPEPLMLEIESRVISLISRGK